MRLPIVGIGAGLVAALLFSVVITGSPLALLLYSTSPLPIFIASLGWNHRSGLVATVAGGLGVALALTPAAGLAFALIIALPAWWIAYLSLLARGDEGGRTEWYPLGNLMLWIAGTAALATIGSALLMSTDYEAYRAVIARIVENLLNEMVRAKLIALSGEADIKQMADTLAPVVPVGIGASFVTTIAVNLWLAAKTVQMSGRLPRPWPFIPSATLPRRALVLMLGGLAAASLGGFVGVGGAALIGALLCAFTLSGLAMLHDLSRGRPWRTPMLISVYVALVLMQAVVTPMLALVGLIDTLLGLRKRAAMPPPPNKS